MMVKKLLEKNFQQFRDKPALVSSSDCLTYNEVYQRVGILKKQLLGEITSDDTVVITIDDRVNCLLAYLTCIIAGVPFVPISNSLPSSDKGFIKSVVGPNFHLTDRFFDTIDFNNTQLSYPSIFSEELSEVVFFTSGTTGTPKGVRHSVEKLLSNALAFNKASGLDENVIMLHIMPVAYMAGILNTFISPILAGGTIVVEKQFSPSLAITFWNLARQYKVNSLWASPTMLSIVTNLTRNSNDIDWVKENIRNVFVGTAPLTNNVRENFESKFSVRCRESYGMTEVMFVSVESASIENQNRSVGKLLDGVEVIGGYKAGEEADILIKSEYALLSYLVKNTTLNVNIKFESGDIGYVDRQGFLHITGRKKDLIIHGGVNVSPRAVEEKLVSHPEVKDITVLGKEHAHLGEEVIAVVETEIKEIEQLKAVEEALKCMAKELLVMDARPSQYVFVEEMPRTSTGKVIKASLKNSL